MPNFFRLSIPFSSSWVIEDLRTQRAVEQAHCLKDIVTQPIHPVLHHLLTTRYGDQAVQITRLLVQRHIVTLYHRIQQ